MPRMVLLIFLVVISTTEVTPASQNAIIKSDHLLQLLSETNEASGPLNKASGSEISSKDSVFQSLAKTRAGRFSPSSPSNYLTHFETAGKWKAQQQQQQHQHQHRPKESRLERRTFLASDSSVDLDKVTGIIGPDAVVKLTAVKLVANLFVALGYIFSGT